MNEPASLRGRTHRWALDDRKGPPLERPATRRHVVGHHREMVEAFAHLGEAAGDGIVHIRLVDGFHQLDAHFPGIAREREKDAPDAFDVEAGFRELFEPELVAPDTKRRLHVVDDDADVTDAVEHEYTSPLVRCYAARQPEGERRTPPSLRILSEN